ncbi:MAG TPA: SCO family protein, partial [Telluria sp.]
MKRLPAVLCSLLLALPMALPVAPASAATSTSAPALKSGVFAPPRAAPEIALTASDGSAFRLSRYRGKLVVLEFGYTSCLEVCPVTLATLAHARRLLGAAADKVQVVFVTVDPARDSAARLRAYLAAFDPGFIGVTGSAAEVDA